MGKISSDNFIEYFLFDYHLLMKIKFEGLGMQVSSKQSWLVCIQHSSIALDGILLVVSGYKHVYAGPVQ